jgi:nucleoside-diphosphate-sugar epimerase
MRVFITGATGFIGSAIVRELQEAGHHVVGLARSDASAAALAGTGAEVLLGSLEDVDSLRTGAAGSDGVIHTAYIHDFSDIEAAARTDLRAVDTLASALEGSGRPLVIPSGTASLPVGRVVTERDEPDPGSAGKHRIPSEKLALSFAERGVRSSVIRLAPSVHGQGDHGFVPMVIDAARRTGVSAYVAEGTNRWPAVHRLDAARLFRLALETAPARSVLHGVVEEGVRIRGIAEVIGRQLELPVRSISPDQAREHFGFLAGFLAADIPASSALTRELMGWEPTQPGLIEDLEQSHYFKQLWAARSHPAARR